MKFNYLRSQNADYIEELYQKYLQDPTSVDDSWRFFFEGVDLGSEPGTYANGHANGHYTNGHAATTNGVATTEVSSSAMSSEAKVADLITTYRRFGLSMANINPLVEPPKTNPALELSAFGLSSADLERRFTAAKLIGLPGTSTLREIIEALKQTYCGTIGVEHTHIQDAAQSTWLETRMESSRNKAQLSKETKARILTKLTEAEAFERFLHTRYVAQKRFSVEGGDALIPGLDCLVHEAGEWGATDIVVGMAHRGRLNVLTNIFGKKYEHVFSEFEGKYATDAGGGEGDVKYHMGYSSDYQTAGGKTVHLSLASNPSHLEFVNPVVEGVARAKQTQKSDADRSKVIPVLIHGDAAFAGQGVVYETIQLSHLKGYNTGGTIHIVVNNQVGFTTNPEDSRSTTYATDLAKMLEAPVFHVNGDDPEALYYVVQLAVRFRQTYHRDVAIDLLCYRKYGHNEGDEPSFTQPLMYKKLKDHPSPREVYAKKLIEEGSFTKEEVQAVLDEINQKLAASHTVAKTESKQHSLSAFEGAWKGLRYATPEDFSKTTPTAVDEKTLREIGKKLGQVPQGFTVHPKLARLLEARVQIVEKGAGIDWGTGEALAFGSLVWEGTSVRVSGQDSERGTFSHRHSVLYDFNTNQAYTPLSHLKANQAQYEVINSALSETAVLGFEFGYSIADPKSLVIWEAQFGDFANGAQVIIDQFLVSSESKWSRMSGLVLLLPHGYEGQGPEHSSARLERFMQMCARYNIQVANLTTPAQIFHALRRQVRRDFRKPLVVMSPKSLLRHPEAVSRLEDFTQGGFKEVIDDPTSPKSARKLILCSGKVYYDLAAARAAKKLADVAIVRVEQLYPWPVSQLAPIMKQYARATEVCWVQEEPRNMGAWNFVRDSLAEALSPNQKLSYIGRGPAAAPAVGSSKVHEKEQTALVEEALK